MPVSYMATCLREVSIETRRAGLFIADLHKAFRCSGSTHVLPAESQRRILKELNNLVSSQSSSLNQITGLFERPDGGFGPPKSVNGSFYHHHTDPSFKKHHPNVDLNAYKSPNLHHPPQSGCRRKPRSTHSGPTPKPTRSTTLRCEPRCEPKATAAVPSIVISDLDTSKVKDDEQISAHTVETPAANVLVAQLSTGIIAPTIKDATLGVKVEVPDDHAKVNVKTRKNEVDREDSGIFMQDTTVPDTGDSEDNTSTVVVKTEDTVQSKDTSQAADSIYGTYIVTCAKSLPKNNNLSTHNALPTIDSPSTYEVPSKADDTLCEDKLPVPPKSPRKKGNPKTPTALRRSARLSALHRDLQPAPRSPLGKHSREPDADTEPEAKRAKDCED